MSIKNNFLISSLVIAAIALNNAGSTLYLPAMPEITTSLHTDASAMKCSLSLFLIGCAISQLIYGPLSDAFGRKINLTLGLLIFLVGSLISSFSTTIGSFWAGRFIEGLGIGAAGSVGYSVLKDIYTGYKLTRQMSYVSVFVGVMPLVAPIIGGYLVTKFHWQACFFALSGVALVILVLKIVLLPETILVMDRSLSHPRIVFRNYRTLLSSVEYMSFALIAALGVATVFTMGSILSFLLVVQLGIPPALYGWIGGIPAIGYLSGSFMSGKLAHRYSLPTLILFGAILGVISMAIGMFINYEHFNAYTLIMPLIVFMFGVGFWVPTGSSGAMAPFPKIAGSESAMLFALVFGSAACLTAIGSLLHVTSAVSLCILMGAIAASVLFILFIRKKYD